MHVSVRSALAFALALGISGGALAACGESHGADPAPHPEVTAARSEVRLVDKEHADLLLYASNQSFDDESVRLTVAVDGVTVVEDDFPVEGQHHWVTFPLGLSPGVHEVTAESETGATLSESFRVPGGRPRYGVIDHWGEHGSAELTWSFQRRPIAFG
jgi:hypothetical protein